MSSAYIHHFTHLHQEGLACLLGITYHHDVAALTISHQDLA
jgi:hypothetical protein